MAFLVAAFSRWAARALEAMRVRRAERAIARFLDVLGGGSIGPAVKEHLLADYLANRPLALHASQFERSGADRR